MFHTPKVLLSLLLYPLLCLLLHWLLFGDDGIGWYLQNMLVPDIYKICSYPDIYCSWQAGDFPSDGKQLGTRVLEPFIFATIICPANCLGEVLELLNQVCCVVGFLSYRVFFLTYLALTLTLTLTLILNPISHLKP